MKALKIILWAFYSVFAMLIIACWISIWKYECSMELMYFDIMKSDCSSPIPKGYRLMYNQSQDDYAAVTPGRQFIYLTRYGHAFDSYEPYDTFSDSCACKSLIQYHYEQEVNENRIKKGYK